MIVNAIHRRIRSSMFHTIKIRIQFICARKKMDTYMYTLILLKLPASYTSMNVFVLIGAAAQNCIFSTLR